jgi:flagellar biogenesis protein FliO
MDEGNRMVGQGRQKQMIYLFLAGLLSSSVAFAGSLTIREITLKGNSEVEILFDSPINKRMLELDYVRDIAQLSIQNSTIYPAKILHAEKQSFNKVFAYQYAPALVRVRFSVDGIAGKFQGKVDTQISGNKLTVRFPAPPKSEKSEEPVAKASTVEKTEKTERAEKADRSDDENDKELLAKIERNEGSEKDDKSERRSKNSKAEKAEKAEKASSDKTLTGKKQATLGGARPAPSAARSMLAMVLVVGGLGAVLFWVKRKKNSQATRVGDNWLSNLLPQGMRKQKSFIEIVGQHALGPKQSITVVKIRGQQFVLGVTQDSVQLISQIDSDETEVDLLEDPAVAASLGKMFGSTPQKSTPETRSTLGNTFATLLKGTAKNPSAPVPKVTSGIPGGPAVQPRASTFPSGASTGSAVAAIGRQQYAQQAPAATPAVAVSRNTNPASAPGIRDQIRKRLEGARS